MHLERLNTNNLVCEYSNQVVVLLSWAVCCGGICCMIGPRRPDGPRPTMVCIERTPVLLYGCLAAVRTPLFLVAQA